MSRHLQPESFVTRVGNCFWRVPYSINGRKVSAQQALTYTVRHRCPLQIYGSWEEYRVTLDAREPMPPRQFDGGNNAP